MGSMGGASWCWGCVVVGAIALVAFIRTFNGKG